MRNLALIAALLLGASAPAMISAPAKAQSNQVGCGVNYVPVVGINCANVRSATYAATVTGLVAASSATDLICLDGSTTKNIHLRRVILTAVGSAVLTTPFYINLNHSLDTGGTPATGKALPVAAMLNPTNPTSGATLISYTANPTVTDASPNRLMAGYFSVVTSTTAQSVTQLPFSGAVDPYEQSIDIPKAATVVQQICVNLNGVTTGGTFASTLEWTED